MTHLLIFAVYYSLEILTFFFTDNLTLFAYLFFNWRKIALQHWVGFCHTAAEGAITTCISPPLGASLPWQFIVCSNMAYRNMGISIRFIKVAPGFIFPKEKHFAVVFVVCYLVIISSTFHWSNFGASWKTGLRTLYQWLQFSRCSCLFLILGKVIVCMRTGEKW